MRNRTTPSCTQVLSLLFAAVVLTLAGAVNADAQRFEYVYGGNTCVEEGQKGIEVIGTCVPQGYIMAGNSYSVSAVCANTDAYVIRTNNAGRAIWDNTYDINGLGGNDEAYSVAEIAVDAAGLGPGFIVTGYTMNGCHGTGTPYVGGDKDLFIMRLDCNGNVMWVRTYGGLGDDVGNDIIETAAGAFVVAGWTTTPNGTQDAYLLSVTDVGGGAGIINWDAAYNGGANEFFNALDEVRFAPGIIGDILAAGASNSYGNGFQGFQVRANGAVAGGGALIPAPRGAAVYGPVGIGNEFFHDVQQLSVGGSVGQVVLAGWTTSIIGAGDEIYLAKNTGNPCAFLGDMVIGDVGTTGAFQDRAYSLREVLAPLTNAAVGDMLITGGSNRRAGTDLDVISLAVNITLAPNGAWVPQLYGGVTGNDEGRSIFPVPANGAMQTQGAAICGYEKSNLDGSGDPGDLYFIKTDGTGATGTGCTNYTTVLNKQTQGWAPTCVVPVRVPIGLNCVAAATPTTRFWDILLCLDPLGIGCVGTWLDQDDNQDDGGTSAVDEDITGDASVRYYPNPVKKGAEFTIELTSNHNVSVEITVTNTLGATVLSRAAQHGSGTEHISINTTGWASGSYLIKVSDGKRTKTSQIVVVD